MLKPVRYSCPCAELIKHHYAWKNVLGSISVAPPFLTSALVGGEWSASRSCHFTPGVTVPGTNSIGCWVDPRPSVDVKE